MMERGILPRRTSAWPVPAAWSSSCWENSRVEKAGAREGCWALSFPPSSVCSLVHSMISIDMPAPRLARVLVGYHVPCRPVGVMRWMCGGICADSAEPVDSSRLEDVMSPWPPRVPLCLCLASSRVLLCAVACSHPVLARQHGVALYTFGARVVGPSLPPVPPLYSLTRCTRCTRCTARSVRAVATITRSTFHT